MPYPVTVYRWDDDGAPQLTNGAVTPSEVINILKKCLVEGYGDKTPLGWTIRGEDADNYKIVFANDHTNGGSGSIVKVWSYDGTDSANKAVWFQPAQGFISMDELQSPGFIQSTVSRNNYIDYWMLIGTSIGFYFLANKVDKPIAGWAQDYGMGVYCGDFFPTVPNDVATMICYANRRDGSLTTAVTSPSWQHNIDYYKSGAMFGSNLPKLFLLQDTDGADHFGYYSLATFHTGVSTTARSYIDIPHDEIMTPAIVSHYRHKAVSTHKDRDNKYIAESQVEPSIRGRLPGWFDTAYPRFAGQLQPYFRDVNGTEHLILPTSLACASVFINLESWE